MDLRKKLKKLGELKKLDQQLSQQADMILSGQIGSVYAPSAAQNSLSMMGAMDSRLLQLANGHSHSHGQIPSYSTLSAIPLTTLPQFYPQQLQQQQVFHLGVHAPIQGGYSYLNDQHGQQLLGPRNDTMFLSERAPPRMAPPSSRGNVSKAAPAPNKPKKGTRSTRITPRINELPTLAQHTHLSGIISMPAQTLGKRPSQHILELKEKISRLRLRKTELDVKVNMLHEENVSLNTKYQKLIDTFGGSGRLSNMMHQQI